MDTILSFDHPSQPAQLIRVGVTEQILLRSLWAGASRYAECTLNHPVTAPRFYCWSETVTGLADELTPNGWERIDRKNLPVLLSPDRSIGLIVSSGDERTGNPLLEPSKINSGPKTTELIVSNRVRQLQMMGAGFDVYSKEETVEWETWVFLYYRDPIQRVMKSELSRPVGFTGSMQATKWDDRWILPSLPLDPEVQNLPEESKYLEPEIEVEVTRKK